ncbi:MAG: YbbR-like domain-containing protein [Bacteroidales bacterium]|nr:YbbR-like domain-containing protein [Bacteroidales bacterium]
MIKLRRLRISYERGRQALLFLFCLFLAFILWAIHNLSATYSTNLNYTVQVVTQKRGYAGNTTADNKLSITGAASGFYILQNRLGVKSTVVTLPVEGRLIKPLPGAHDKFYIVVKEITDVISDIMREHLEIESYSSDTIYLTLPLQSHREMPVAVDYKARFKDQYMPAGKIKISPSTVTVYGELSILNKIDSIRTEPLTFERLSSSRSGVVDLMPIPGLRYEEKDFYYTLEVVRYVENTLLLPVETLNVPSDKFVRFFPNKIKVVYRVPLRSTHSQENAIFAATIDYNDIASSISNTVEPKVTGLPEDILSVGLDPKFIQCKVIEK